VAEPCHGVRGADTERSSELVQKQVRGSSLLLAGRIMQLTVNLAVQLLVVRYLSKAGYGAFAYALAFATVGETVVLFGLDRAVARLMPIAIEEGEYGKAFGVLLLSVSTVLSLGVVLVVLVLVAAAIDPTMLTGDAHALALLVLLIAFAPIQALEDLLVGMFGVLARPRTIFVRTYVVAPALRLAVGVLLVALGEDARFLAVGYVLAAAVGLLISAALLVRILRAEGLLAHFRPSRLQVPVRETFAFTVPLLSTDLVNVLLFSSDAVLLGHFRGPTDVASFRVIVPAASLNAVPASVFTLLFVPLASAMFGRSDLAGLGELYRRTTAWVAVLCFPVFAVTCAASVVVTGVLYGARYASSATFLSILAVGYYAHAVLGFSGLTLMVHGRVRVLTGLNVLAIVFNLAVNLALIPRYGALGAAVGTTSTLLVYNALKQVALRRTTRIGLTAPGASRALVSIAAMTAAIVAAAPLVADRPALAVLVAVAGSATVVVAARALLDLGATFPELARLPVVRRVLAKARLERSSVNA
jgi:O-antigen/teichoic acid export membrane protein